MSALLEKQAATQAGFFYNIRRQFQSVPPIPAGVRLDGKTVLVTGANVGLGLACARYFLELGAVRLIMAVRTVSKGEAAATPLRNDFPSAQVDVWPLDLERPWSVQAFATRCAAELGRLHVAVLNAGLAMETFVRTSEGKKREATLQVNYLSTALLAILLLPTLKPAHGTPDAAPGRLTLVSSDTSLGETLPTVPPSPSQEADGAGSKTILLDAMDDPATFQAFPQYGRSKLLLDMFAAKLAADVVRPQDVVVNLCNPAATRGTGFFDKVQSRVIKAVFAVFYAVVARTPRDAARMYVHASLVLGPESHGSFTDWQVRSWPRYMYGAEGRKATDRLWDETLEELAFANVADVLKTVKG
ncbi:hypothetical protein SCUCBS95973_001524 [Sporothrix curviconia]|uniref:Uncharacterized protein n=1 Tax=Sporothrix curviconia TaxID=1260050 RepID=A0ABP0AZW7_9PEZI